MGDKAFIFDLNGTMIDDMEYHTKAWYGIFNEEFGANLNWEEVKKEMYGKNKEVLVRVFGPNKFTEQEIEVLSVEKEKRYQQAFKPHLKLIDGLKVFLDKAYHQNIKLAIGSAAIADNVDFVLDGLDIRKYFSCIICADHVQTSKPHPETFLKSAEGLGVDPGNCIVFEDAPKGVEAAQNAGMKAVVITTMHQEEEFAAYSNIIRFINNYNELELEELL